MQVAHGNFSHRSFASNLKDHESCDIVTDEGTGGGVAVQKRGYALQIGGEPDVEIGVDLFLMTGVAVWIRALA
jgi:6-phosphogluconate dehydrogenase (decarboxylating)